jgi:hypothetical protein
MHPGIILVTERRKISVTCANNVYGEMVIADGNKLTIRFDKAGEKRVVDSFVERV